MLKIGLAIVGVIVVMLGAGWIWAPSSRVATSVHIAAAPVEVWQVLTNTEAYPEWNPLVRTMTGKLAPGETVINQMAFLDGSTAVFEPTILTVEPEQELRWFGQFLAPGIADGEHEFLLSPQDNGTRVSHAETFKGLAVWFLSAETYRDDFERFNQALKSRVEMRED